MKLIYFLFFCFLFVQINYAQENINIKKTEGFIIEYQQDSALYYLSLAEKSGYKNSLDRILKRKDVTYSDYHDFVSKVGNRSDIDYQKISDFIDKNISIPNESEKINLTYVKIKWLQISKLRDEKTIESATLEQVKLENYIDKFDELDVGVQRAKILESTHQIVLYIIEENIKDGKNLCLSNLKKSRELNDKELEIVSLYFICDFLIFEGKLDEYISICEEILMIEKSLTQKTSYYLGNIIHLLDAYIYKGGHNTEVLELLNVLYSNTESRVLSYSLYVKFLGDLEENSPIAKQIYKQFGVLNIVAFCLKVEALGETSLNILDKFQLQREISIALERKGFLKESIAFVRKSNESIKEIYSDDLANSLANYRTEVAVKEKEKEVVAAKEKSTLYLIIVLLTVFVLVVSVIILRRRVKLGNILRDKNLQVEKALKEKNILLKEKELLVREIHHRVKNNFQIVASLLELQTKNIEDKKAIALANEGQQRIKSMALIHQKLYQTDDGLINFDEYIVLLIKEISALFASDKNIKTSIHSKNILFDVDTAIPLGLIVNELITNAYKYAFTENDKRYNLDVSITKENDFFKLVVSDNGKGLNETINIKKIKSLGLRLVSRLTRQLQGIFEIKNQEGATFIILFKDARSRKEID